VVALDRKESLTRRHIIDVAAQMVRESGSDAFRIVDLAERAHVGVPTIYYHFDSRSQIIAEAQMANYFAKVEPLHRVLSRVETAVSERDQAAYWQAIKENMEMVWSSGQMDEKVGIVKLFLDVWADPKSRLRFSELLDVQFARWVAVANDGKRLGWMADDIDTKAMVAVFWAASVGQIVMSNSNYLNVSPVDFGAFYMRVVHSSSSLDDPGTWTSSPPIP
jgi:AcrR family transcriptional regulator